MKLENPIRVRIALGAIPIAIALAALYWLVESALRASAFHDRNFVQQLLIPDTHEIWTRLPAVLLVLAAGIYAQIHLAGGKRAAKHPTKSRASLKELVQQCTLDLAKASQKLQKDIIERRQLQEILRENEEKYQSLVEGLNEAIYRASLPDGACEYISPAALSVFGYHAQDFIADPLLLWKIIHPDFLGCLRQQWANSMEGNVPPLHEYKIIDSDGDERWIRQTNKTILDDQGTIVAIEGRCRNITEDKWTEEALRQVRDQVNRYIDFASEMFLMFDLKGRITLLNNKACKILGGEREDLLGKNWLETFVPHRVRKDVLTVFKMMLAGETEAAEYYENPILTQSGEERIISWHNSVLRSNGGDVIGILASGDDVTERRLREEAARESEDRFRELRGAVFDGAMIEEDECLIEANQALADLLRYERSAMVGGHVSKLFTDESWPLVSECIQEGLEKSWETTMIRHDGSTVPVEMVGRESRYLGRKVHILAIRDIAERRQAEETLRQSEIRFKDLAWLSPQPLFEVNTEGKITFANQRTLDSYGYTREDLETGLNYLQLFIPQERERMEADMQRAIAGEELMSLEYTALRRDRTTFPVLLYLNFAAQDGEPAGIRGIAVDITERKLREEALQQSEADHRVILNALPDLLFRVRADGTLLNIQATDGKDSAISPSAWLPKSVYDIFPKDLAGQIMDCVGKVMGGNEAPLLEYRISQEAGDMRDFEARFSSCGDHAALVVTRDITERKRAEETLRESEAKYRSMIENSSDAIYILAGEKLELANRAFLEMLQITPEDWKTSDFNFLEMVAPRSRSFIRERQRMREKNRALPTRYEFTALRKDGEEIELEALESEVPYDGRAALQCSVRNITDRKRSEVERLQAQKMEAVGRLAADIAHEIKAPAQYVGDHTQFLRDAFSDMMDLLAKYESLLRAVKSEEVTEDIVQDVESSAEKADLPYLKEEIPKAADQVLDAVKRVAEIVRTIKEYSPPDLKEKDSVDIDHEIQSIIASTRNQWKDVAKMVAELDQSLPMMSCHESEIHQVLLSVIVNAIQATADLSSGGSKRKGVITVSTRRVEDGVEIRVTDTGKGIPENLRSRIFDPFFTTRRIAGAAGQGLAIAHSIVVNKYGGTISFKTTEGKGTTFTIRLPFNQDKVLCDLTAS